MRKKKNRERFFVIPWCTAGILFLLFSVFFGIPVDKLVFAGYGIYMLR